MLFEYIQQQIILKTFPLTVVDEYIRTLPDVLGSITKFKNKVTKELLYNCQYKIKLIVT